MHNLFASFMLLGVLLPGVAIGEDAAADKATADAAKLATDKATADAAQMAAERAEAAAQIAERRVELERVALCDPNKPLAICVTSGALVVPFKWQLTGKGDVTGSSSIGAYLGARTNLFPGASLSFIGFAGVSPINTSGPTAGTGSQTAAQTVFGISYGIGLIGKLEQTQPFEFGVVFGFDHTNASANYAYNNKPWLSFQIGYSFDAHP